jgi:hypothetical protein
MQNTTQQHHCTLGDLVLFNGVALFYQQTFSAGDLMSESLGLVLKKIKFCDDHESPDDCHCILDGNVIQEPKFVYTLLCKGQVVEVLDIDVNKCIKFEAN